MAKLSDRRSGTPIISIEGTEGQSVFHRSLVWALTPETVEVLSLTEADVNATRELKDDRLLALHGAMLIEEYLDGLVESFLPGYRELAENRDVSFSVKIAIARSASLIPSWILDAADAIRLIRNEFAHQRAIADLASFDAPTASKRHRGHMQRLRHYHDKFVPGVATASIPNPLVFGNVVSAVVFALAIYSSQVRAARRYMDSPEFRQELSEREIGERESGARR